VLPSNDEHAVLPPSECTNPQDCDSQDHANGHSRPQSTQGPVRAMSPWRNYLTIKRDPAQLRDFSFFRARCSHISFLVQSVGAEVTGVHSPSADLQSRYIAQKSQDRTSAHNNHKSLVVTHSTTNRSPGYLCMQDRTGSPLPNLLWPCVVYSSSQLNIIFST